MGNAILIVEDNENDLELLICHAVMAGGINNPILTAKDALQAMLCIPQEPCLMLIDLTLPGMGGVELIASIRRLEGGRHIPIIVATGSDKPEDHAASIEAGANVFLKKPIHYDKFLEAVLKLGFTQTLVGPHG